MGPIRSVGTARHRGELGLDTAAVELLGSSRASPRCFCGFARPRIRSRSIPALARDTWLRDAVVYVVHGRWLAENEQHLGEDGQITEASNVLSEMRQLARDGGLSIWGKPSPPSTYEHIPPRLLG